MVAFLFITYMAPPQHATAEQVDSESRYGVKPPLNVAMHDMFGKTTKETASAKEQREEARRLSQRSQSKWVDAAERGEMVRVTQLLEQGQDINEVCYPQMSTALYIASRTNNLRLAELLLKKGADPAVLTDDLVSPCWIATSRGFDKMVELLLDPKWSSNLVKLMREETAETLKESQAGVQQTHIQLATARRYWRCVFLIERTLGTTPEASKIPPFFYQPPDGWAVGMTAAEPGQRPDMPMKPFYWKAFEKGACQEEPPEGSKKLVHKGEGRFVVEEA